MIRYLFSLILFCSADLSGQILQAIMGGGATSATPALARDAYSNIPYSGFGGNSISHTATGSNLVCVLRVMSNGTISSPSCNGHSMTLATSHASSLFSSGWTMYIYIYVGPSAGSITVSYSSTAESTGSVETWKNAKQSGQPDATATYVSSTSDGSRECALAITTVADKSAVVAFYMGAANVTDSPSSNGTLLGGQDFGTSFNWDSTLNATPAGSFSLKAKTTAPGVSYEAIGISIAPL